MFVRVKVWSLANTEQGNDVVLLKPQRLERAVPIFIGQNEAHSIFVGLTNISLTRPCTHDLIATLLNSMNITLKKVEITDLKDGIFYSLLYFSGNDAGFFESLRLDCRPSDALALAVRFGCPIYMEEKVIDQVSVPLKQIITNEEGSFEKLNKEEEVYYLEEALQKALAAENYEEAAILRDKIKDLSDFDSFDGSE